MQKHPLAMKASAIAQGIHQSPGMPFLRVRTTFASGRAYAPHMHESLSIGLVFAGRTRLTCRGGGTMLAEGDIAVIAPEEVHSCNPVDGGGRSYHMLYVECDWALSLLGGSPRHRIEAKTRVVGEPRLFAGLVELARAVGEGREPAVGRECLAAFVRGHCRAVRVRGSDSPKLAFSREILKATRTDPDVAVAEVAREMGMGREGFIRRFRRTAGITPGSYRQCLRLSLAQRLLAEGGAIAHAALAAGYADQSHLHRMCVKYLAATPAQLKPGASLSSKT